MHSVTLAGRGGHADEHHDHADGQSALSDDAGLTLCTAIVLSFQWIYLTMLAGPGNDDAVFSPSSNLKVMFLTACTMHLIEP